MVTSAATSVADYLDTLPSERRAEVERVRKVVNKHMPKGFKEGMASGMIAWSVPLAVYPDTYNKQLLIYAALASQKNHLSLYLMCVYANPLEARLRAGFKAAGKKLDMGKSCVRFKAADDLALDAIAEVVAAVSMEQYIQIAKDAHKK